MELNKYEKPFLNGKIAIVTGTSRGIGRCIAERFAEEGAVVYANAVRKGCIDQWSEECNEKYIGKIIPQYYDITDSIQMKNSIMEIKSQQEKIDILVNNAGIMNNQLIGMIKKDEIEKVFKVNVFAVIEMMQYVTKLMIRKKEGSIINISSIVAQRGNAGQLVYSASKGAVISLTMSAAKELSKYNIRVNAIAPGLIQTDAIKSTEEQYLQKRISNITMGRLGEPIDVANSAVFLASDLSKYISGEVLGVNGCSII